MSSKKGKKNKGKTVPLTDFLQGTPGTIPTLPIRKSTLNWADEVEDNHDLYDPRAVKASVVLPTAPKASRDFDDIIDKVPQDPPFIAYLSNLPYDVDESEIEYFFKNMKISNMRIPKDERPGEAPKLKGFGYVEFEDRDSLLNALLIPDTTIKNRRIRIEVASDYDDKRRSGRMDMNRDRGNRSEVSSGDWRSGPRQEVQDNDRRGYTRGDRDDSSTTWRDGGDRRSNRDTDRSFTRSTTDRYNRDDKDDFNRSRNRGGDDDYRSSRDDRFMSRRYDDKPRSFSRRTDESEKEQQQQPSEPRQRPKLVLAPRTKPVEATPEPAPAPSASIFGNAKPVDTSARERQIEERLAKENEAVTTAPPPAPPPQQQPTSTSSSSSEQRDVSRDRRPSPHDRERAKDRKERDRAHDSDKRSLDRSHQTKSESNGVVEKTHQSKKNGDEKREVSKTDGGDKHKPETKKRDDKKERTEKEMPKLKKQDPPNFVASNKFAFLETEDNSD